ncbi:hypothetical protein SEA_STARPLATINUM_262 [Streptomyces phage StarPlatinum]|uniref:Uncharacterized protein n=1 Tax=Streptomyces phage StarPlatinum TaxID=2283265 RepID=A0A345M8Z4_9CAUD|nr:hypothetical protein HWB77_gp071 [Streptomyces phage StarPlatinum]AXH66965.1 hypothetical protein SEA_STARPLATINUM_262 [Streptomyces phage StarPlatinum]
MTCAACGGECDETICFETFGDKIRRLFFCSISHRAAWFFGWMV